jgi:serine/threonine protein kinase
VVNERIGGRYQIVALIGSGGMGRVYQAVDTETGRAVAAKVLMAGSEVELDMLLRFQQEGAVLATLQHPNIVEVLGTFLEGGMSSIVMELLEGGTLRDLMRSQRLDLERSKNVLIQVASALAYAHARGVIHRDIKPDNIMLVGNDHVKVTDFGVARIMREGGTLATKTGLAIGTPLYMAPEQVEGSRVDGRADIYSLGAVMYQMATGRPPFEGDDPLTVAFKQVHRSPDPPSTISEDVPSDWEAVILKALAKNPADRFQTATAMEEAITALSTDPSTAPRARAPVSAVEPPPHVDAAATGFPSDTAANTSATREPPDSGVPAGTTSVVEGQPAGATSVVARPARAGRNLLPWILGGAVLLLLIAAGVALALSRSSSKKAASPTPLPTSTHSNGAVRTPLAIFGSSGSQTGQFRTPAAVAVDQQGNLFVADTGNNRVQELASSGDSLASWSGGGLSGPLALALDVQGNVYVSDTGNNRIVKLSPSGKVVTTWGSKGSSEGQLNHPSGIAVDSSGGVYVADTGNDRIEKFSSSGHVLGVWGSSGSSPGQFSHPLGLAVDGQGNVYVADSGNNRVQELASTSDPIAQWGSAGSGKKQLRSPGAVAVDTHGNIYVADTGNDRVQEFSPSGALRSAWGKSGSGNGEFSRPDGIAVDLRGNVYVADGGNGRIQKFGPAR